MLSGLTGQWIWPMEEGTLVIDSVGDGLGVQGNVHPGYLFPPLPVLTDGILMGACMVVVISPAVNYFLDNDINMADIIFNGVACFLVAAILGTGFHSSNAADIKVKEKLNRSENRQNGGMEKSNQLLQKGSHGPERLNCAN